MRLRRSIYFLPRVLPAGCVASAVYPFVLILKLARVFPPFHHIGSLRNASKESTIMASAPMAWPIYRRRWLESTFPCASRRHLLDIGPTQNRLRSGSLSLWLRAQSY